MSDGTKHEDRAALAAILTAAAMIGQQVAGKAVRDAFFLTTHGVTALPAVMLAAAAVSVVAVALGAGLVARLTPGRMVPFAFLTNTVLFAIERLLAQAWPSGTAVVVYLHLAVFGALVTSSFWSLVNERFDPYTAKKLIGRIAGGGTLGGIIGGLSAERIAARGQVLDILPFMAALSFIGALTAQRLVPRAHVSGIREPLPSRPPKDALGKVSSFRTLASLPYLRALGLLVIATAITEALVDYAFKAGVKASPLGPGEDLGRFFATFYTGVAFLSFIFQIAATRWFLGRLGLAVTVAMLPIAVIGVGAGYLVAPGLAMIVALRAVEAVFRGSLFLSGYELFYTPVAPKEKRPAKTLIDVGLGRLGNALGSGLVLIAIALVPLRSDAVIVSMALGSAGLALIAARRLHGAYVGALEERLRKRAVTLSPEDVFDSTTRATLERTLTGGELRLFPAGSAGESAEALSLSGSPPVDGPAPGVDPGLLDLIADLHSGEPRLIRQVLQRESHPRPEIIGHLIPLLATGSDVHPYVVRALRGVADRAAGQLLDALLDPETDFVLRRRIPRVLKSCSTQRAADGLLLGLKDERFEVRRRCARALVEVCTRAPEVKIPREIVLELALKEVELGRENLEYPIASSSDLRQRTREKGGARERARGALEHVFVVLSLTLEREPLLLAYRAIGSTEPGIRGTALEYLETVLPPPIRQALWPYLGSAPTSKSGIRTLEETREELLRSKESIVLDLGRMTQVRPDGAAS